MWNYLRLISMLREKDETEYNGWESHVGMCLANADTSFMPRDALSLSSVTEMELAEEQERAAQAAKTATSVAEMSASFATLNERQETTSRAVSEVAFSLSQMQATLTALVDTMQSGIMQMPPTFQQVPTERTTAPTFGSLDEQFSEDPDESTFEDQNKQTFEDTEEQAPPLSAASQDVAMIDDGATPSATQTPSQVTPWGELTSPRSPISRLIMRPPS